MVFTYFNKFVQEIVSRGVIHKIHGRWNMCFTFFRRESTSLVKMDHLQEQVEKKMKFYMKAYEDVFGITKLAEIQNKVLEDQKNLQITQEKRRKVQEEYIVNQNKLEKLHDIGYKHASVVNEVHELLNEQKRLQDTLALLDLTEREQQTTLFMSMNIGHNHAKTCSEKSRYLSLISGIIGAILGLAGSSINNWRHRKEIKNFAAEISDQCVHLKDSVDELKLASSIAYPLPSGKSEDLLSVMKYRFDILDDRVKSLQSEVNDILDDRVKLSQSEVSSEKGTVTNSDGLEYAGHIEEILNEFKENIETRLNSHTNINIGLIGSCSLFFSLFVYFVTRSS